MIETKLIWSLEESRKKKKERNDKSQKDLSNSFITIQCDTIVYIVIM